MTSSKERWNRGHLWFAAIWNDPVWSKVIAVLILGVASLVVGRIVTSTGVSSTPKDPVHAPGGAHQRDPERQPLPEPRVDPQSTPNATGKVPEARDPGGSIPSTAPPSPPSLSLILPGAFSLTSVAVLFCDQDSGAISDFTNEAASSVPGGNRLFTNAFVTSGGFARAMGGDVSALTDAGITGKAASLIVFGIRSVIVTQQQPTPDHRTFKADVSAFVRVFRPQQAFQSHTFKASVEGAGFDQRAAVVDGDRRLVEAVVRKLGAFE